MALVAATLFRLARIDRHTESLASGKRAVYPQAACSETSLAPSLPLETPESPPTQGGLFCTHP